MGMARSGLLLLVLFFLVLPPDPFQSLLVSGLNEEQDVGERGMTKREEEASEERFGGEVAAKRYASVGGGRRAGGAPGALNHHTNSHQSGSNTCNTIIHFGLTRLGVRALLVSLLLPFILCSL